MIIAYCFFLYWLVGIFLYCVIESVWWGSLLVGDVVFSIFIGWMIWPINGIGYLYRHITFNWDKVVWTKHKPLRGRSNISYLDDAG